MNRATSGTSLIAVTLLAGCGGGGGGGGAGGSGIPTVAVTFVYLAATARDPNIPDCGVGATHIHPSWRDFTRVNLNANGPDEWRIRFNDVPVGGGHSIRINDANKCPQDPNGATTENIFANGVRLTRVVGTPGNGTEPGLSFGVDENGVVSP